MSQIDKVNYIPILFWFFLSFCVFYMVIFTLSLPLIYTCLNIRNKNLNYLITQSSLMKYNSFMNLYNSPQTPTRPLVFMK